MFNRKNKVNREKEMNLSNLRIHFTQMDIGKRVLLIDGRIGIFKGYTGGLTSGDTFLFKENGVVQEVPIELYDSVLVSNPNLKCPLCEGERIMDGLLKNPDGTFAAFRENITCSNDSMPTFNSRKINLYACRDCGYIMPFLAI